MFLFRVPILFVFCLLCGWNLPQARILFHSGFELGQTFLATPIKPGERRIALIPNGRLEEWPLREGRGIIEANLETAADTFAYGLRKGNELFGVRGIRYSHVAFAPIQTGGFSEWEATEAQQLFENKPVLSVVRESFLFGSHCLKVSASNPPGYHIEKNISAPEGTSNLCLRFYVIFSKALFDNDSLSLVFGGFDYKLDGAQRFCLVKKGTEARIVLTPFNQMDPLQHFAAILKKIHPPILPGRNYCIEFRLSIDGKKSGTATLLVDGVESQKEPCEYAQTDGVARFRPWFGLGYSSTRPPGEFYLDEFVMADSAIGAIPGTPLIGFENHLLVKKNNKDTGSPVLAEHWQINSSNSWLLPLFDHAMQAREMDPKKFPYAFTLSDTLNEYLVLDKPITMLTGLAPRTFYYGRARYQDFFRNWSQWSAPIPFQTADFQAKETPGLPGIRDCFFSEVGWNRPLKKIVRGKWYDLHIFPWDSLGWKNLGYADVYLSGDPENIQFDYRHRGGPFRATQNYLFSFSLSDHKVFIKDREGEDFWSRITNSTGLYFDDANGKYEQNENKGEILARVRLLPEAEPGPWVIKGYVANLEENKPSKFFSRLFFVLDKEEKSESPGIFWVGFAVFAGICLAGFAIWLGFRTSRLPGSSKNRGKGPISLSFDSPYDENIKKARDFILANSGNPISPNEVALAIGVSPNWLSKFFRRGTGKSVTQYIHEVKMEQAKKLLDETKLSVSEIAFKLGFKDDSHFHVIFRKIVGKRPSQYRERPK